jgi:hypothetical protein
MGVVELWTLYAFAVSFTFLRAYARISAVGFRELQADDCKYRESQFTTA